MSGVPPRAAFLLIVATENDAARFAAGIDGAIHLPSWDAAPLSDRPPSAASQAARLLALAAIEAADTPRVVCSAQAAAQAVPSAGVTERSLAIVSGDAAEELNEALAALGYEHVGRTDAPGTFARYGATTDLWPADRDAPVRLRRDDGAIASIEPCDPHTLLSDGEALGRIDVPPCTSNPGPDGGTPGDPHDWSLRWERRTLLDLVGNARRLAVPGAVERGAGLLADLDEEDADRAANGEAVPPRGGWLSVDEWKALVKGAETVEPDIGSAALPMPPHGEFAEEPLEAGDLVVHLHHGIGIYRGVETLDVDGDVQDALLIEFLDADAAVPAHEADLVWRYGERAGEDDVTLAKVGDEHWPETVAKLMGELREAATEIRRIRAERDARDAPRVSWDRGALKVLEADWHTPTPDQASALRDVREDMDGTASAVSLDGGVRPPMDRLLCGDTGFGKTEIIVRAAAATVEAGYQAIVAAPTTILADQHGVTIGARLEPLGIAVRVLTGATPTDERDETLAMLADGTPMVLIGTHLLANDDVLPKSPGLLVMDEEQRFGAAIKTALRAKEPFAHVLATTATPIPRTMMAALVGLRSVSTLRTPPPGRRGVRTEVTQWDAPRLRRVLVHERDAGGRSFVIVPRIEDMEAVEKGLADLTPGLAVATLHGKLDDRGTAERLRAFRGGEVDVLLSTTVVETGIDVPEANLMAILDAGRFGVGQLHQLRGRVGRGGRRGRALLFASCEWIDCVPDAASRLDLLARNDHLGAGFALAARDLAQRGSGDLFGDEQTGHTQTVGLELYARLMRDALDGKQSELMAPARARLHFPGALIPASYVPHADVRARLYGRIAKARNAREVEALRDEMADRFGPVPEPATRFLDAASAAARARALGVTAISAGPDALALDVQADRADALSPLVRGSAVTWKDARVVLASDKPDPQRLNALLDAFEKADETIAEREGEGERREAA